MYTQRSKMEDKPKSAETKYILDLSSYPVDMSKFLTLPHCTFDAVGIPYHVNSKVDHPTIIAQYALAHWNQYLATNDEYHLKVFLLQASWFIEHETRIGEDSGGWLISFPHPDLHTRGPWLSALTQGSAISVLTRAYQLTHEEAFLEVAHRAIHTFELDILDGGVSTPLGEEGVFFEEVAVYPAAHMLSGFIFALFGLYDYVALTGDAQIETLVRRSLTTMHHLLDEFDLGFWTCSDLLHQRLASPAHLELQSSLLEAIAKYSGCEHCRSLALHWKTYPGQFGSRLRYLISRRCRVLWHGVQTALFPRFHISPRIRVCVPIASFPVTGGTRSVLARVAQVTADIWQLEYLTQYTGLHSEAFVIHKFGTAKMRPWQFPVVWLYFLAGFWKLISLMRHGVNYHVILPQDGVFTAAFAALAAKLAGIRTVCIDHGSLTLLKSHAFRTERIQALATKSSLYRLLARPLYVCYWPSLYLLARISARLVDHFLIPGVAGDGVEEVCKRLGVPPSRITRLSSMIDIDHHVVLDVASKANIREKNGIDADAIVIAMVCRLAPEKGIDIALEAVSQALSTLPPDLCARVRFIIAGDGPLRKHVEKGIRMRKLDQICALWGDISAQDVLSLLAISDIFLYTSTRGACFPMAVLEAMASGCAVIASTQPIANALLLAEGRGIAVPASDVQQTSMALVGLLNDLELCRRMGTLARDYIAMKHSAAMFKRTLMRVTYWSGFYEPLNIEKKIEIPTKEHEGSL